MIELHWMVIVGFICFVFGGAFATICFKTHEANELVNEIIDRAEAINEATELVIEAAIRYGYIEDSRSEGDYDLNVSKIGTEKIRKILEAL